MTVLRSDSALVVFSGGQDSTTCLAWALDRFKHVATVGFDYGQRHVVELECRKEILKRIGSIKPHWAKRLERDDIQLNLRLLAEIGGTAMTKDVKIEMGKNNLPNTFVPGRNLLFLTAAAACAYRQGIKHLVTGVCETDYSGYPDCRDDTMKALQVTLNLGMETRFVIHTPLMWTDKKGTWELAEQLGGKALVDLVRDHSHTCYQGNRTKKNAWGYGCGTCPACELRAKGYRAYAKAK